MPLAKKGVTHTPESFVLNGLHFVTLGPVTTGAAAANTVALASFTPPTNLKISKVAVSFSATGDAVTGIDSFNLVVGGITGQTGQAYTQGVTATNDNSYTATSVQPGLTTGNYGFPTNFAVAGNALFIADIPLNNAAAYAYIAPASGLPVATPGFAGYGVQGTGWITIATTGGTGIFIPSYYDAVYPAGVPISLRATSTTSITNLQVALLCEPMGLRGTPQPGATAIESLPGVDL